MGKVDAMIGSPGVIIAGGDGGGGSAGGAPMDERRPIDIRRPPIELGRRIGGGSDGGTGASLSAPGGEGGAVRGGGPLPLPLTLPWLWWPAVLKFTDEGRRPFVCGPPLMLPLRLPLRVVLPLLPADLENEYRPRGGATSVGAAGGASLCSTRLPRYRRSRSSRSQQQRADSGEERCASGPVRVPVR